MPEVCSNLTAKRKDIYIQVYVLRGRQKVERTGW